MFQLIIKNADDSVYWTEHFPTQEDLQKWLDEEKTRPYWKKDYKLETLKIEPKKPSQEEIDLELQKRAAILTLKTRVKELSDQADLTAPEVKELVRKYVKYSALIGQV